MPLILCECALHRFRQKPPNWIELIDATFKFNSALKRWLVCTNSYAIILWRLTILCSKNRFPISLLDFLRINLIISHMKVLITSQSDQLILQFLHFIPTIQPKILKYFYVLLIFYATSKFCHKDGHSTVKEGRGPRTTADPKEDPKSLEYPVAASFGEQVQLLRPLSCRPGSEQPEPLPAVETR